MLTADDIDAAIAWMEETEPDMTGYYGRLSQSLPVLTGYLIDRDTELLTDAEHDYLLFLGMIITRALTTAALIETDIDHSVLEDKEEGLWEGMDSLPEEVIPLYEFVEESLEKDEDTAFLTEPGIQIIKVKLVALAFAAMDG